MAVANCHRELDFANTTLPSLLSSETTTTACVHDLKKMTSAFFGGSRFLDQDAIGSSRRPSRAFTFRTDSKSPPASSRRGVDETIKSSASEEDSIHSDSGDFASVLLSNDNHNNNTFFSTRQFEADAKRSTRSWAEAQLKEHTLEVLKDFQLNKLNWKDVPLAGREADLQKLTCNYKAMLGGRPHEKVLSIRGKSGTGKSKLAMKLKERVLEDGKPQHQRRKDPSKHIETDVTDDDGDDNDFPIVRGGFFCVGKFDMQHHNQVRLYQGFVTAMDDLVTQILKMKDVTSKSQILDNIFKTISSRDMPALVQIAPSLSKLLTNAPATLTTASSTATEERDVDTTPNKRSSRQRYLFRKFIQAICCRTGNDGNSIYVPLVLMLDDMQWADQPSLDLIETLSMMGDEIPLLLLMTSRDDETPLEHPFSITLQSIQTQGVSTLDVPLDNLTVSQVNLVVSRALRSNEDFTLPLAKQIHKKSHGNPLYVTQFLQSLIEEDLLSYNIGTMSWAWDVETIDGAMQVTENVAGLLTRKVQRVSKPCQCLLQAAACLGEEMQDDILALAYDITIATIQMSSPEQQEEKDDVYQNFMGTTHSDLFEEAEQAGVLQRRGNNKVAFVHDQIQSACYRMIPDHLLERLELEIGRNILALAESTGNEQYMFLALDLCNSGSALLERRDRLSFAEYNLSAANRAMNRSAFLSANAYIEKGLFLLRHHKKDETRTEIEDTIFELNLVGCEACYCIGKYGRMEEHMNAVMLSPKPSQAKVRMYMTRIASFGAQERFADAVSTGLNLLNELGTATLPPSPGKEEVDKEFKLTVKMLERFDRDALLALPEMTDEKYIVSMGAVDLMYMYTLVSQPNLFAISFMRSVRWTLKFGVCKYSPPAFATFATLLQSRTGDLKTGEMFGEVALNIAARLKARTTLSKTTLCVYSTLHHWSRDMRASTKPYMYGYQVGMETGDVDSAMLCLANHDLSMLLTGSCKLPKLLGHFERHGETMMEYKQCAVARFMRMFRQFIDNLIGNAKGDPVVLTGAIVDEDDLYKIARDSNNNLLDSFLGCYRMQLAYIFGDYKLAGEISDLQAVTDFGVKLNEGEMIVPRTFFFRGLAAFAMAQQGSRKNVRHYRRQGAEILKKMKKWHQNGNVNISYMVTFLEAEQSIANKTTNGKSNPPALFEKALVAAGRAGCIHDRALIHDRAGRYHLSVDGDDKYWAAYHFDNAIRCYEQWGAFCVARKLSLEHKGTLQSYQRT